MAEAIRNVVACCGAAGGKSQGVMVVVGWGGEAVSGMRLCRNVQHDPDQVTLTV